MNSLISIIVPVHNVGRFISRCVFSLLSQNYNNYEILLIDDGSTDDSGKIIDSFQIESSKIKVFHFPNKGVSFARNIGISHAKGNFLTFVDGDDWVENNYLSTLLEIIKDGKYDLGFGLRHLINDSKPDDLKSTRVYRASKVIENIYYNNIYMAVWNKIYKKSFLLKHNIWFNENIWYSEGMLFNVTCLSHCAYVGVGNIQTYHYVSNPDSTMRKRFSLKNELCVLKSLEIQRKGLLNQPQSVLIALNYHTQFENFNIISGLSLYDAKNINFFRIFIKKEQAIRKNWFVFLRAKISLKQKIRWMIICINPNIIINKAKKLIH